MKRTLSLIAILVLAVLLVPFSLMQASWQPYNTITELAGATGNIGTTTLFTAPLTGYYSVSYYMEPQSAVALSTAILTISYTSNGVARSMPALSISLASGGDGSVKSIHADAGTAITFSLTSISAATYNLHIGWKPQGS